MTVSTKTPVLTVGATYATGDYVGTSGVAIVFDSVGNNAQGGLNYVLGATCIDGSGATGVNGELWIFDSIITPPADSAAWSISDADAKKLVCVIPFSTWYASALNVVSHGIPAGAACYYSTGNLYGCFVTRGSWGGASLDLTLRLYTL